MAFSLTTKPPQRRNREPRPIEKRTRPFIDGKRAYLKQKEAEAARKETNRKKRTLIMASRAKNLARSIKLQSHTCRICVQRQSLKQSKKRSREHSTAGKL